MKMKHFVLACGTIALGLSMTPVSSSAYHSFNYFLESSTDNMCTRCHPGGPGNGFPDCINCHTAEAPPYSVEVAPLKQTHSNAIIGSDKYGDWSRECRDCHEPHHNNGITKKVNPITGERGISSDIYKLAEFTGKCISNDSINQTTTMSISDLQINDPAWSNPDKWVNKTDTERGLVLMWTQKPGTTDEQVFWYKVLSATETEITFLCTHTYFPAGGFATDQDMSLGYGQFIKDGVKVDGYTGPLTQLVEERTGDLLVPVTFSSPRDMVNVNLGSDDAEKPGICQVCHTQTTYWRNDGSRNDHFDGWRCTICHPHDQGFKTVTIEGCICPEGEICNEQVVQAEGIKAVRGSVCVTSLIAYRLKS